jgi:hypothetical protein
LAAIIPRPNLIAQLTSGHSLPLAPIAPEHLSVILETISSAWFELSSQGLTGTDEPEVNQQLKVRLTNYCDEAEDWKDIVRSVALGNEAANHLADHIELRPDLTLCLYFRNGNFPLVIECKILDHPNQKTVAKYCNDGLARFIDGRYSWWGQEAIMLAYVRDASTVAGQLVPYLATAAGRTPDPFRTAKHPSPDATIHSTAHRSEHGRTFSYSAEVDGGDPGAIRLWHLWLSRT